CARGVGRVFRARQSHRRDSRRAQAGPASLNLRRSASFSNDLAGADVFRFEAEKITARLFGVLDGEEDGSVVVGGEAGKALQRSSKPGGGLNALCRRVATQLSVLAVGNIQRMIGPENSLG